MHPNFLLKSVLHSVAGLLTGGFALLSFDQNTILSMLLLAAAAAMLLLVFYHDRIFTKLDIRTSLFFLFDCIVLAIIAWRLYGQGYHKATFFFEGLSIVFLSLAAFSFMLRKKRNVLFTEEDIK